MHRRILLAVSVALFSLALIGCGPPWVAVMQTTPNPFVNQSRFSVLPIDFTGLEIGEKPEGLYLSEKDPEQRESFQGDKAGVNEEFTKALMSKARELGIDVVMATGPNDAPFLIRASVPWIEPGYFAGIMGAPSQVRMRLQIMTADGRVLDEIGMKHLTGASVLAAASGSRLRKDGEGLGEWTARYLGTRVHPEQ
jgi:hypothetical protein